MVSPSLTGVLPSEVLLLIFGELDFFGTDSPAYPGDVCQFAATCKAVATSVGFRFGERPVSHANVFATWLGVAGLEQVDRFVGLAAARDDARALRRLADLLRDGQYRAPWKAALAAVRAAAAYEPPVGAFFNNPLTGMYAERGLVCMRRAVEARDTTALLWLGCFPEADAAAHQFALDVALVDAVCSGAGAATTVLLCMGADPSHGEGRAVRWALQDASCIDGVELKSAVENAVDRVKAATRQPA